MFQMTHDGLTAVEDRLRGLREQKASASALAQATKAAASESGGEQAIRAAREAAAGLKGVEARIEDAMAQQIDLLKELGDAEAGHTGLPLPNINGWQEVAKQLDLQRGVTRADVAGASLLRAQAPSAGFGLSPQQPPSVATPNSGPSPVPGPYYGYQVFPRQDTGGAASVTDFTVSFSTPTVTGMERAPAAVTDKPVLPATYALATPDVRQHAIVAENVPNRLLTAPSFGQFLDLEMRRQVDLSVDRHVVAQITAASPPSGSSGSDLVTKIRNAVTASRALGSWPSVLLLSPADRSTLDLTTVGADGLFLFSVRDTGSSSPVWSLNVVESAAVTNPILLDPARLGVLYVGAGSVTVDDLTGLKQNVARLRAEIECLAFVRSAQSAYVIA